MCEVAVAVNYLNTNGAEHVEIVQDNIIIRISRVGGIWGLFEGAPIEIVFLRHFYYQMFCYFNL